ncbi:MAG: hypothetical protein QM621_15000 [Aeromicrobium sp.]|uniref:hypothetical protein n=1 Tax=Aeromicrobium sp. TaxID=1871063 RepID=UPI0039E27A4D
MAEIPAWLLPHTVTVETYAGASGLGDRHEAPQVVDRVRVDHTRRLVRDENGDEVVSEATVYARTVRAPLFTPGTRVDLGSRVALVIAANVRTDGGAGGWQHVEVTLT